MKTNSLVYSALILISALFNSSPLIAMEQDPREQKIYAEFKRLNNRYLDLKDLFDNAPWYPPQEFSKYIKNNVKADVISLFKKTYALHAKAQELDDPQLAQQLKNLLDQINTYFWFLLPRQYVP